MAYRGDEADALEAPTAEGPLRLELGPRQVKLTCGHRSLHLADKFATVVGAKKDKGWSIKIEGKVVIARDVPREDLGVWIELPGIERAGERRRAGPAVSGAAMRRIFGVEPVSLMDPEGLSALRRLDLLAQRLRGALDEAAGTLRRAFEIGRGRDKVLLADHGDHYVIYARRLFRDRAHRAMAVHDDGRIIIGDKEIVVTSRYGITVSGDYVRFADRHGMDLARVSIPWIGPEDRDELARRIGQLVDRTPESR